MKSVIVSLCVLCAMVVSGCETTGNLQTSDADLARRILAKHCIVGLKHMGSNATRAPVREGVISKHNDGAVVRFKHKLKVDRITVYSVKDLIEGWVVVDASSQRVRDNMYFNRETGEFVCSTNEWRYGGGGPMERTFEVTPLILTNGGWGVSE